MDLDLWIILLTSVECEKSFSKTAYVNKTKRSRLSDDMLCDFNFLKIYIKQQFTYSIFTPSGFNAKVDFNVKTKYKIWFTGPMFYFIDITER